MKGIGQRTADMPKKLAGAVLPGTGESKGPACLLRYLESAQARGSQVLVQDANRVLPDHVARARHQKRGARAAAGKRPQLNDPERVGPARKYEHVRGRQVRSERAAFQQSQILDVGEVTAQIALLRSLPDHDLGARQIEREKSREVFLNRDPAHADEDRPREGRSAGPGPPAQDRV